MRKQPKVIISIEKKSCENCELWGIPCSYEGKVCDNWNISLSDYEDCVDKLPENERNRLEYDICSEFEVVENDKFN